MTKPPEVEARYPSRSGAGAHLGRQLYQRATQPMLLLGITPTGVEIAANASQAMQCKFDVIVAAHIRIENTGIIGAVAEDGDAVIDQEFEPRFSMLEALDEAIDRARRAVKTERLLFRGQRQMRSVTGMNVVIVDGHLTTPWKALAAVEFIQQGVPERILLAAPVSTKPGGHPRPFGDPHDPSAERLRSIVVARETA